MVMLIVLSVSIRKIVIEHSKLYNVNDTWCHKFLSCTVYSKSSHIAENPSLSFSALLPLYINKNLQQICSS